MRGLSFLTMVSSIRSCLDCKVFKKISELSYGFLLLQRIYVMLGSLAGIEVNFLVLRKNIQLTIPKVSVYIVYFCNDAS